MAPVCTALVFELSPLVDQLFSPALLEEVICSIALQVILCFPSDFGAGFIFPRGGCHWRDFQQQHLRRAVFNILILNF